MSFLLFFPLLCFLVLSVLHNVVGLVQSRSKLLVDVFD